MSFSPSTRLVTINGFKTFRDLRDRAEIQFCYSDILSSKIRASDACITSDVGRKYLWRLKTDKGVFELGCFSSVVLEDGSKSLLKDLQPGAKLLNCTALPESPSGKMKAAVGSSGAFYLDDLVLRDLVDTKIGPGVESWADGSQIVLSIRYGYRDNGYSLSSSIPVLIFPSSSDSFDGIFVEE